MAFHRLTHTGAADTPELLLIDVSPNMGAINRSALISSDQICIPLAPDLFSLPGLRNLGPTLGLSLPKGTMQPVSSIVMQHGLYDSTIDNISHCSTGSQATPTRGIISFCPWITSERSAGVSPADDEQAGTPALRHSASRICVDSRSFAANKNS